MERHWVLVGLKESMQEHVENVFLINNCSITGKTWATSANMRNDTSTGKTGSRYDSSPASPPG